jgi:hypothetical protein
MNVEVSSEQSLFQKWVPSDDSEKPLEIRSRMAAGTKVVNI